MIIRGIKINVAIATLYNLNISQQSDSVFYKIFSDRWDDLWPLQEEQGSDLSRNYAADGRIREGEDGREDEEEVRD